MESYLDLIQKELNASETPISYRLLSRKLRIHVNEAKNELNRYFQANKSSERPLHATFMVTGEVGPVPGTADGDEMDVDTPAVVNGVLELKCIVVDEDNLEDAKASFSNLRACHIYSLSLSTPNVSGISACDEQVRVLDGSLKFEDLKKLGKVLGSTSTGPRKAVKTDVKSPMPPTPSGSKLSEKSTGKPVAPEPPQKASTTTKEKPKATGKLDWSNAKVKGASTSKSLQSLAPAPPKEQTKKPTATKANDIVKKELASPASTVTTENKGKKKESETIPVKKEPSPIPVEAPSVRVKKGAVLSDDEEEEIKPKRSRLRKKLSSADLEDSDSERDRSLRAMMDIDDSEVIRASTSKASEVRKSEEPKETEPESQEPEEPSQVADNAMDEDSDPAPKVKPRKRKEKKVIPVGRNGLKKRRVVKSEMKMNDKGYMVTEDYSSYESVDEEEEDADAKEKASSSKAKAKEPAKKVVTPKGQGSKSEGAAPAKVEKKESKLSRQPSKQSNEPKRKPSTAGNQKNLMNFFGAKTNK